MGVQRPANDRRLFSGLAALRRRAGAYRACACSAAGAAPRVAEHPRLAGRAARAWRSCGDARARRPGSLDRHRGIPRSRASDRAKRLSVLVGRWTETSAPHLLKRIRGSIDTHDPRVTVVHRKGRIAVRVAGKHVVAVTRFAVTGEGIKTVHGDLTQASGPIKPVAEAVERALARAPVGHVAEPSPALLEAVYVALEKRMGATMGELATAMGPTGMPSRCR